MSWKYSSIFSPSVSREVAENRYGPSTFADTLKGVRIVYFSLSRILSEGWVGQSFSETLTYTSLPSSKLILLWASLQVERMFRIWRISAWVPSTSWSITLAGKSSFSLNAIVFIRDRIMVASGLGEWSIMVTRSDRDAFTAWMVSWRWSFEAVSSFAMFDHCKYKW